ncbi:cuticular protein 12A [Musca autumnalis]|uniref:cuticular protein 12A n=1 Tax=Musca autumnalis TaxID=221902 RepID=UPI003CEC9335
MTKTIKHYSCILVVLAVLLPTFSKGFTEAAITQQQQQRQHYQKPNSQNVYQQSYVHGSVREEQRKPAKQTSNVPYDHVEGLSTHVVEQFDHRHPDGSYEYRYELSDGTARYEKGYFLKIDKIKELVVVGYYSYRMPTGDYITVFYNADRYGYRQNHAITRTAYPDLPRTIEVSDDGNDSVLRKTPSPPSVTSQITKRPRV